MKSTTIEVVVDRVKVAADIKQRLAESFETSLRVGEGKAIAANMETGRRPCSPPSSPARLRLLALRNGSRACFPSTTRWRLPVLRWLGEITFSIRTHRRLSGLSLAGGAIKGWDRRNSFISRG